MLAARVAPAELMVMVKANAYGHGLLPIARAAVDGGVRLLGVLDAESGLALRADGIGGQVRLFAWLFGPQEDYRSIIDADIDLGISHLHQLERIAASGSGVAARLHLKIDTGLHRNGASEEEWPLLIARALELQFAGIVEIVGAWTHISEASDDDDSDAIARFERAITVAEAIGARFAMRHLAASAAGFAREDARFDVVRVGAFAYGIAPGGGIGPSDMGIEPVMTLTAPVASVREHEGRTLARVAIGFADGLPGHAGGRGELAIRGRRHPIVGAVGAFGIDADVTGHPISAGDVAVLFGPGGSAEPSLQEWADALGTIGEELVVRVPPEVRREYTGRAPGAARGRA